mgnify:CR=1 FL=1
MFTKEEALKEIVARCANEIDDWDIRVGLCLEYIDKWRCPSEMADSRLCDEIQGVIDDFIEEEDDDEGTLRDIVEGWIDYDDVVFY